MPSYAKQRCNEILDLTERVRTQIILNEVWDGAGIPFQVNSEGRVVVTRPILFSEMEILWNQAKALVRDVEHLRRYLDDLSIIIQVDVRNN